MLRKSSSILATLLWAVGAGTCRAEEQPRITPDVIYGHKDGMALVMHVYKPEKANGAAVVQINSGGYFSIWEPANARSPLVGRFLKSGFTVFSVFHGSNPKYNVPEIVVDLRRAVRFIRLHAADYGIDARRIGVIGGSAGGHLALMLATTGDDGDASAKDEVSRISSRIAAAVALAAPSDLRDMDNVREQLLKSGVIDQVFADRLRPAFNYDRALADSVSPVLHVTPDDAPTLFIHGDVDRLVSIDNSRRIFTELQGKGVPTELLVLPGVGHDATPSPAQVMELLKGIDRAAGWFDRYLAAPETQATSAEGNFFDSNGVKIHYVVEGQGEPIVLVHGVTGSIQRDWRGLGILSKLSQDHQVIALDHRGHGKSDKPFDAKMYGAEMAADVVRLMDHLNIKKSHIVGYSLGGLITEYLLVHHPDRIITATIGGMGWIKADDERMAMLKQAADALETGKGGGPLLERLRPTGQATPAAGPAAAPATGPAAGPAKPAYVDLNGLIQIMLTNNPKALVACLRAIPGLLVTENELKANQVPALAIIGGIDPFKDTVDDMAKVMANLQVEVIDGGDHATALSSPKFVDSIKAFLDAHSTAPVAGAK